MREVQFAAGGRKIEPTFPLIGTPFKWERPLDGNAIALDSRERPIVLWNPVL